MSEQKDGDITVDNDALQKLNSVRREWGIPSIEWEDDADAPPIDQELIERYTMADIRTHARDEIISPEDYDHVLQLSQRFRPWMRAVRETDSRLRRKYRDEVQELLGATPDEIVDED